MDLCFRQQKHQNNQFVRRQLDIHEIAKFTIRDKSKLKKQLLSIPWHRHSKIQHKQVDISTHFLDQFLTKPKTQDSQYYLPRYSKCLGQRQTNQKNLLYASKIPKTTERTNIVSPKLKSNHKSIQPLQDQNQSHSLIDVSKNLSKIEFFNDKHKEKESKSGMKNENSYEEFSILKQLNEQIIKNDQRYQIRNEKLFKFLGPQLETNQHDLLIKTKNKQQKISEGNKIEQNNEGIRNTIKDGQTKMHKDQINKPQVLKQWSIPSYHSSSQFIEEQQCIQQQGVKDQNGSSSNSVGQSNKLHQFIMKTQQLGKKKNKITKAFTQDTQINEMIPFKKSMAEKQSKTQEQLKLPTKTIKVDLSKYIGPEESNQSVNSGKDISKKQIKIVKQHRQSDKSVNQRSQQSYKQSSHVNLSIFPNLQNSLNAISISKLKSFVSKDQNEGQQSYEQPQQNDIQLQQDNFQNYQSSSSNLLQKTQHKKLTSVIQENQDSQQEMAYKKQLIKKQKSQKGQIKNQRQILERQFMQDDLSSIKDLSQRKITENQTEYSGLKRQNDTKALKLITQDLKSQIESLKSKIISDMNVSSQEAISHNNKRPSQKAQQQKIKSNDSNIINVFDQLNQEVNYDDFRKDIEKLKIRMINDFGNGQ